jgi:hypothetical protein
MTAPAPPAPPLLAPTEQASESFNLFPIRTVIGFGTVDLSTAGATPMSFAVAVAQFANGHPTGEFWQKRAREGMNIEFRGRLTCLAVDLVNRRAWIGGVILENRSTDPLFRDPELHSVGKDIWFRVLDNKFVAGDEPDRSTTLGFKGSAGFITSADYCAGKPWPDTPTLNARTFPVSSGNLIIR